MPRYELYIPPWWDSSNLLLYVGRKLVGAIRSGPYGYVNIISNLVRYLIDCFLTRKGV